ncbi:MAG: hypothetical protein IJY74_01130, partial [Oscillospiraceae bacterium]|nr:hypothetical protein [Oscillospiraceae bacterium]
NTVYKFPITITYSYAASEADEEFTVKTEDGSISVSVPTSDVSSSDGSTTATTTATSVSTEKTTTTIPADAYTWVAGEYWQKPGDFLYITPKVYNCPGDIMTVGVDFVEDPLIGSGAITPTELGDVDCELGDAYPTFNNMAFTVSALHCGGTDKDKGDNGVAAAADGSVIAEIGVYVADAEAVKAAAESLGLTLMTDEEHGSYYAFPLAFDQSIDPQKNSPKCEAVNVDEEFTDITFVDGYVNVIVADPVVTTTSTTATTKESGTTTTTVKTTASSSGSTSKSTATSKSEDPATTTKITTTTQYKGLYVQMAARANEEELDNTYVTPGEEAAVFGLEAYNADYEIYGFRGKFNLSDALAEVATPYVMGSWIESYAYSYNELWGGVTPEYIFSTNNTNTAEVANGELLFGAIFKIAPKATVKTVAEKYGIEQVQGADGTWYYPFPIYLDTSYANWEWLNAAEENVYPEGIKLVEESYVNIVAEAPFTPSGLYVQMEGRSENGGIYISPGETDAAIGLVPYETNGGVTLGIRGKYKMSAAL